MHEVIAYLLLTAASVMGGVLMADMAERPARRLAARLVHVRRR